MGIGGVCGLCRCRFFGDRCSPVFRLLMLDEGQSRSGESVGTAEGVGKTYVEDAVEPCEQLVGKLRHCLVIGG